MGHGLSKDSKPGLSGFGLRQNLDSVGSDSVGTDSVGTWTPGHKSGLGLGGLGLGAQGFGLSRLGPGQDSVRTWNPK